MAVHRGLGAASEPRVFSKVHVIKPKKKNRCDVIRFYIKIVIFYRFASLKDPSLIRQDAFIDGKWVSPKGDAIIKVTNPATTEVLGTVPDFGVEETRVAIDAAGSAFKSWSKTTAKQRHDILKKFYDLMLENTEDLSRIITLENGKTLAEAKVCLVTGLLDFAKYIGFSSIMQTE
ncbi:succinate semialdehyde dehydrogenase NADP+ linked [Tulasnella sp. 408]|nr:succinate semialdehyde dehydrogenase NADP+ linked [Tulasnella sp. 408]